MLPELDQLMANAWPPEVEVARAGWRCRWTQGVTRRANSALAVGGDEDDASLTRSVEYLEAFYQRRGAAPLILVSEASAPAGLVGLLHERGYLSSTPTGVWSAATAGVIAATSQSFNVDVTESPTDRWFAEYRGARSAEPRGDSVDSIYRDTLLTPGLPTDFVAVIGNGGATLGVCQIVVERGWAGVQCMITNPEYRRRRVGRTALHAAAISAERRGADRMYLAVMDDNVAARALYEAAGFAPQHSYEYFTV